MFWKFDLHTTSHVDTLLDKEDVTLSELLDEDDILQECKAQNRKLIDFLVQPEIMEEMVNLVIQEPPENIDEALKYKHSNSACELLTADVAAINDKLGETEVLLNKLWGFLDSEPPLNPLLASFFSKCMAMLLTRKTECIIEFIKTKDDPIGVLVNHIGTSAIMDLILRLASCAETAQLRQDISYWLNDQRLIQRLVGSIDPTHDEEKHSNASLTLCELIRLGREHMSQLQESADDDPLLTTMEQQETVSELMNHMLHEEKSESALANGIAVLLALTEFKKNGWMSFLFRLDGQEQLTALDAERLAKGVSSALQGVTPKLRDLHQLLTDPPKHRAMPTTIGMLEPPLGNTRLQVARLIAALLLTNTHTVNKELCQLSTLKTLLDLFFQYTWNNFLHTQVEQCINTVISNTATESEDGKQEHPMLAYLFSDCKLIERILDCWEENDQLEAKNTGKRKGYMGHLTRICNDIVHAMDKGCNSQLIKTHFKEHISQEDRERWDVFVSGSLAETNKKNSTDLVGGHPLHSSSEDDDADFRDIPFPQDAAMQQAFSDYQMQQMTSNFIDQFGFNDEDFGDQEDNVNAPFDRISDINFSISANEDNPNSALFEACCNERIQQFNDSGSDEEDIWEEKELTFSTATRKSQISPDAPPGEDAGSNHSDNSTDSDEEENGAFGDDSSLPAVTAATVTSTTAQDEMKMDVDSSEGWANFDDAPMETVAMDTTPSGWDSSTSSSNNGADDTGNTSLELRSSSPIEMESEPSDVNTTEAAKYLVRSPSPNLISSETIEIGAEQQQQPPPPPTTNTIEESTKMEDDSQSSESQHISSTDDRIIAPPETDKPQSSDNIRVSSEVISSMTVQEKSFHNKNIVISNSEIRQPSHKTELSIKIEEAKTQITITDAGSQDSRTETVVVAAAAAAEEEDDDLSDNFNFLSSSGLMKSSSNSPKSPNGPAMQETTQKTPPPTSTQDEPVDGLTAAEKAKLEQVRAQAREALQQWDLQTQQNGPV